MADRASDSLCGCCLRLIFTLGLTALALWLSLRTSDPACSLHHIYIPALDKTLNSPENNTLFFTLRLKNTNKEKGVYYGSINVTFFDSPNRSHPIGNFTIPNFHQGHGKKADKGGQVETTGLDREAVSANGSAVFRVDMVTTVRYEILNVKTKRHGIQVGANVPVNDQGTTVNPKKDVKFKSSTAMIGAQCGIMVMLFVNFVVFALL